MHSNGGGLTVLMAFLTNERQKGDGTQVWEKAVTHSIFDISYIHFHRHNFMIHGGFYRLTVYFLKKNAYVKALTLSAMVGHLRDDYVSMRS